jgi:uncharacterized protein YkwD
MKFRIFSLLLLVLVIVSCEKEKTTGYSTIEVEILNLVNSHRTSIGKEQLVMNQYLFQEALQHTLYMISIDNINHDNFSERVDNIHENIGSGSTAENVAFGYNSASAVVEGWLNSDGHKRNIEGNYNMIGIAARKNDEGRYFYTQIFLNYQP